MYPRSIVYLIVKPFYVKPQLIGQLKDHERLHGLLNTVQMPKTIIHIQYIYLYFMYMSKK